LHITLDWIRPLYFTLHQILRSRGSSFARYKSSMPKNAPAASILSRLMALAEKVVALLLEPEDLPSAVPVALTAWL
jgi:hypothetical protein